MLCKTQYEIGFIGSSYFIGLIFAVLIVPKLADSYGRVQQIRIALLIQTISQVGLIWTNNLIQAYFFMFMLGLSAPGKNVVWYNYALEITTDKWRNTVVNSVFAIEASTSIWIALYYQTVSNSWFYLQVVAAVLTVSLLPLVVFGFAESPKYLYTNSKFNEARTALKWIGYLNGAEFDDNF